VWARLYRRELTEEDVAIYGELLSDLSPEHLEAACRAASKKCTFFPTPAEIRAGMDRVDAKGMEIESENAWQKALAYIREWEWGDGPGGLLPNAPRLPAEIEHAIRAANGPQAIMECVSRARHGESEGLVFARKRFIEHFSRLVETKESERLLTRGETRKILAEITAEGRDRKILPAPQNAEKRTSPAQPRNPVCFPAPAAVPAPPTEEELRARAAAQKEALRVAGYSVKPSSANQRG